jgi:hypothetical protein
MSQKVSKTAAIILDYNGIECNRIEAWDISNPTFFVTGPRFDIEAVLEEMKDENQTVFLPAMLRSVEKIDSLLALTKKDGVWSRTQATSQ